MRTIRGMLGKVAFNGGAPEWLKNDGEFEDAIADDGTGLFSVTLKEAIDTTECCVHITPRTTLAASGAVSAAHVATSDTVIQFRIAQEQAAGAASALADVNVDISILSY